jgi:integrase
MNRSTPGITPLRQRMLEDMHLRKLEPKTQASYVRAVRKLAGFLERSPDTASAEDLRRFQLHLVDQGTSAIALNATLTGLKFFFDITLGRGELLSKMSPVRVPQTLPVVLSREEVARLIAAVTNLKHQTALTVAYGAGLRASEVIALKVGDIDSERMTLRVEQGKAARTATPCSRPCCWSDCAIGGASPIPRAGSSTRDGCSPGSIRWTL